MPEIVEQRSMAHMKGITFDKVALREVQLVVFLRLDSINENDEWVTAAQINTKFLRSYLHHD